MVCFVLYLYVSTLCGHQGGWRMVCFVLCLYVSTLCGHQGGLKGGLFCAVPVCQYTLRPSRWVEGWSGLCCTCLSIHSAAIKVGWSVVYFVLYLYVSTLRPSRWLEGWSVLYLCVSTLCGYQGGLKGGLCCTYMSVLSVAIKVG